MMDGVPIRKLPVRNFATKDLRNYFSKYGMVKLVTFTNVADAVRAKQDGNRKRIHNRDLRVMAAAFRLQPDGMEQRLNNMGKELSKETNKASERRIANEQYFHNHLQNDTESVSIHMLNDDCLKHIFQYLPILYRVRIEIVCKRWRDVSQDSWYMLKTLDLSHCKWGFSRYTHKIHTDLLHKILLKCGRFLTHVNLSHWNLNLSQTTLNIIGSNLTNIDVTTGLRVCPSAIRTLANNCRNITKFSLGPLDSYDNNLKYFFKQNQKLEYLVIIRNKISGESLLSLPELTMRTIKLIGCFHLLDNYLSMALKRLKNLKNLVIKACSGITERTFEVIGQHCKNLRALVLNCYPPMTDPPMSYLIPLVDLQILRITNNPNVSDNFLADLVKHCQQLTLLDITGCGNVSDAGLAAVARLVNLEKLDVSIIQQITDNGLKNICGLKELACVYCEFTDQGMSTFIKSSPQLQLLDLTECRNITDTTLEVAKHACSNRTNNVMLKMNVNRTSILTRDQEGLPPLLHVVRTWWK